MYAFFFVYGPFYPFSIHDDFSYMSRLTNV